MRSNSNANRFLSALALACAATAVVLAGPSYPPQGSGAGLLRGVPVSSTAPTTSQTIVYDGSQWVPASVATALDLLGTTRGSIIYKGLNGWAILAPGTATTHGKSLVGKFSPRLGMSGNALTWDFDENFNVA